MDIVELENANDSKKSESTEISEKIAESAPLPEAESSSTEKVLQYDVVLWMFGMLFIILLMCAMFGIGALRGWDSISPYNHNMSADSMERFLPEPIVPEPGVYKRSDPGASSRWYYWKLRPELVTPGSKYFAWICYCTHNLSVWLVLYLQQKAKTFPSKAAQRRKYSSTPDRYNLIAFVLNIVFHILHLVNTHTTYDGTAADVHEASSQSAVIVALVLILFIEFQDRGIFFGYPTRNQLRHSYKSVMMSPVYLIKKFHGYFIYWGAIYDFWYHPMENTWSHGFGFVHTWMFMLQGSLAYQNFHMNKYWRLSLELWVTMHAGVTAYITVPNVVGEELWPMFVFGFSTVFILTQFYGLPFWSKLPGWTKVAPVVAYIAITVSTYAHIKDVNGQAFTRLAEIVRIPGIYYVLFLVSWLVIAAVVKLKRMVNERMQRNSVSSSLKPSPNDISPVPLRIEVIALTIWLATYIFSLFISWYLEYLDIKLGLIVFTMAYCFIFLLVNAVLGSFILNWILPAKNT